MKRPRLLFVHPALWIIMLVLYGTIRLFEIVLRHLVPPSINFTKEFPLNNLYLFTVVAGSFLIGIVRLAALHPALNGPYRNFLRLTPWNHRLPLPLGPLHLVWQDLLFLLLPAFLLARFHLHLTGTEPLIAFFLAYLLVAIWTLAATQSTTSLILQLLGLPAVLLLFPNLYLICLALALLTLIASLSLRASLKQFPWPPKPQPLNPEPLGFPFNRIGPFAPTTLTPRQIIAYSFLPAWLLYCFLSCISPYLDLSPGEYKASIIRMMTFSLTLPGFRLLRYIATGAPPLSLFGRIATGNLLFARYDVVYLAPLASAVLAITVPAALALIHLPFELVSSVGFFITLLATLALGPSLHTFRLTAPLRIRLPANRPITRPTQPNKPLRITLAD